MQIDGARKPKKIHRDKRVLRYSVSYLTGKTNSASVQLLIVGFSRVTGCSSSFTRYIYRVCFNLLLDSFLFFSFSSSFFNSFFFTSIYNQNTKYLKNKKAIKYVLFFLLHIREGIEGLLVSEDVSTDLTFSLLPEEL